MAAFRYAATRSLRSLTTSPTISTNAPLRQQLRSRLCTLSRQQGLSLIKPAAPKTTALVRWASTAGKGSFDAIDKHHEAEVAKEKLEAHPELVSSTSSTHPINSEVGAAPGQRGQQDDDQEMSGGIMSDLVRYSWAGLHKCGSWAQSRWQWPIRIVLTASCIENHP